MASITRRIVLLDDTEDIPSDWHVRPESLDFQDVTTPAAPRPTTDGPDTPVGPSRTSSQAFTDEASGDDGTGERREAAPSTPPHGPRRCGRPDGKFPLCPEGRCEHTAYWSRIRAKRAYVYFFCKHCGLGWCAPKTGKEEADRAF